MKNNLLLTSALAFTMLANAQSGKKAIVTNADVSTISKELINGRGCATAIPGEEWNKWFNEKVEEFVKNQQQNKTQLPNYTIPVIVHVVHGGQSVGTYPNVSQAQINSQIAILNNDYAGIGLNNGNAPAPFAPLKANCNINFCLAQKDPTGATLLEPGIERINYISKGWANPTTPTTPAAFQTFVNGTIKPNSIWDPTRYLNIWLTDCNNNVGLLGYATFPAGTGLAGVSSFLGTASTDGIWNWSRAFGNVGTLQAPYNQGRTASHEIGHWLGLIHIGGDGNGNIAGDCNATDYCADTPPQKGGFASGQYGQNYGAPTYPLYATGSNSCAGAPNGNMFMNFMDYTDDAAMYMFTNDQRTRMQTAMANGTFRSLLTTSAASLCNIPAATPSASFNMASNGCINSAVTVNNLSSGNPVPTFAWSSIPATGVTFNPNNTAQAPTINFANPGSYTITVVATNSLGSNNNSKAIVINNCAVASTCLDTLVNFDGNDTLNAFRAGADVAVNGCSPNAGYILGNNCYDDLEKAEYFPASTYTQVTAAQATGVIVLFFKNGSRGTGGNASSAVTMRLYDQTVNTFTGTPSGIKPNNSIGSASTTIGNILAVTSVSNVTYCGSPNLAFGTPIIKPFKYTFATPINLPASGGFFASVVLPTGAQDTAVIFNNGPSSAANRSFEKWSNNVWYEVKTAWSSNFNYAMAILPIIQCASVTAISDKSILNTNINLYPNPSSGDVSIIATLPNEQTLDVQVTNVMGQVLYGSKFTGVTNNVFNLNLGEYSNGVYFVTINNGSEKITKRVILNK